MTPRLRGLLIGNRIARRVSRGEITFTAATREQALRNLAAEPPRMPTRLRNRIVSEHDGVDAEFWTGFMHGVRAHVLGMWAARRPPRPLPPPR
jgi:hypothetical protein